MPIHQQVLKKEEHICVVVNFVEFSSNFSKLRSLFLVLEELFYLVEKEVVFEE
jgi:hypothetical protein